MEMLRESWGTAVGSTAPSPATLVGPLDQALNVDFGKLSQGE